jgi:hypothetical protein
MEVKRLYKVDPFARVKLLKFGTGSTNLCSTFAANANELQAPVLVKCMKNWSPLPVSESVSTET